MQKFHFIFQECEAPNEGEECEGVFLPLYENPKDFCGCCPRKCVKFLKENEACLTSTDKLKPDSMCGPQLCEFWPFFIEFYFEKNSIFSVSK